MRLGRSNQWRPNAVALILKREIYTAKVVVFTTPSEGVEVIKRNGHLGDIRRFRKLRRNSTSVTTGEHATTLTPTAQGTSRAIVSLMATSCPSRGLPEKYRD